VIRLSLLDSEADSECITDKRRCSLQELGLWARQIQRTELNASCGSPPFVLRCPTPLPDGSKQFAGKSLVLAESLVRPPCWFPILALGQGTILLEAGMAKQNRSSGSLKAVAGATLLALGLLLLFANLDAVADTLNRPSASSVGPLGSFLELGLAGLRATQAYFFDHPSFQAGLRQILLSCWPLLLVILGVALLQNAIGKSLANSAARLNPSGRGEHN